MCCYGTGRALSQQPLQIGVTHVTHGPCARQVRFARNSDEMRKLDDPVSLLMRPGAHAQPPWTQTGCCCCCALGQQCLAAPAAGSGRTRVRVYCLLLPDPPSNTKAWCAWAGLQAHVEVLREECLMAERAVLYTLGFDLNIQHPYKVRCAHSTRVRVGGALHGASQVVPPSHMSMRAYMAKRTAGHPGILRAEGFPNQSSTWELRLAMSSAGGGAGMKAARAGPLSPCGSNGSYAALRCWPACPALPCRRC